MKKILSIAIVALMLVGCEGKVENLSVANKTYEKIYADAENSVWELVFTTDSLHSYWKGDVEVSASYIQNGSKVECVSTKGNNFTIIAGKDYVIYDDKTFTLRQ